MTPEKFVEQFAAHGSVKAVGRALGISYRQARNGYTAAVNAGLMTPQPVGRKTREETKAPIVQAKKPRLTIVKSKPKVGVKRYVLSCAQNATPVNPDTWNNLLTLADHYDAEVHISRFSYLRNGLGASGDKAGFDRVKIKDELYWDPAIEPYVSDQRLEIAPDFVWCGEMNILPTAVQPLSGLLTYTGAKSAAFPHAKIALESVADFNGQAKFAYTTGAVTERNYIQRKAGLKAEFHHCLGGLLVEVRPDGKWWARQLNATSKGTVCDLDVRVEDGRVTTGNRVKALTPGDLHEWEMDPLVRQGVWGSEGMVDVLRPEMQFFHDAISFFQKCPHVMKKKLYHDLYRTFMTGPGTVEKEVESLTNFLANVSHRGFVETVLVDSNHHRMFLDWMHIGDYRTDPANVLYFLEAQKWCYEQMTKDPHGKLNLLKWSIERNLGRPEWLRILDQDESFIICPEAGGGIECGMHGHQGINGSRGQPRQLARMGHKANIGHVHTTGIYDGVYVGGTCSRLRLMYTNGPSSWSHSHIVTYDTGKRAIVTMRDGEFRA